VLGCVVVAVCLVLWVLGVGSARASFGLLPGGAGFSLVARNQDGSLDTQAGSHPYAFTANIALNTITLPAVPEVHPELVVPDGNAKDIRVELPPGFSGNPGAAATCLPRQLQLEAREEVGPPGQTCPTSSQVGMVELHLAGAGGAKAEAPTFRPVYNMATAAGQPAVFGFQFESVEVYLDTGVRTGGDYGLTSSVHNISTTFELVSSSLTLWGVPADPSHDSQRCILPTAETGFCENRHVDPEAEAESPHSAGVPLRPFLTLPTSCTGPQPAKGSADSWQDPGVFASDAGVMPALEGCERLSFSPSLAVAPDTTVGGSPSGLGVDVRFPQEEAPFGLAEGNLKKAIVTLPAGMVVNPATANGLGACTPEEIGLSNANPVACPESAKVGSAEVVSPSLHSPLVGSVYVAQQGNNPFGSLLALYLAVEGEGVLIKSAGEVHLDPVTGQLTSAFDNIPQQPVSDIKLHFFAGPRAALVTPVGCGSYTTTSQLTPYHTMTPAEPSSAFQIASGANGTGCGGQSFAPVFVAGTVSNQAGGFSPFSLTFARQDQEQDLSGVSVKTPPGLLGILKSVQQCGEPQAAQGTCGPGSLIGHATATAGAGPDPVGVTGQVFLTGPYKGAPFGLSIVVPAAAGPFNLGNVVVRSAISVDPHTAQITVASDPFPTILQGIPLQIKSVDVSIDREGFVFNPTNCEPLTVAGTLLSTQGASASVSSHFQAANCAALAFKPSFTVSTQANTSKKNGASLDVKVGYPQGAQANIRSVAVTLPKQLPSRLSTIQQACTEVAFAANPASCPVGSNIGTATATTPVLANPLTGPVYLVSHGGAAFPDVVIVFQGEGITLDLVGSVNIKKSITSSTFASVPDAPISSFELSLPEGPHSGLAAVVPAKAKGNLCGQSLVMPTTITGQNGAQIRQNTKIQVTGCSRAKKKARSRKHRKGRKR
jgi:hypothetical protein